MANTVSNVTAGKPKISGGIYVAPLGTALPTDASTALNVAFVCLGYVGEDGVTNNNTISSNNVKAWGGDTVLSTQTDVEDTFDFTLLEGLNANVLKAVFGDDNVTGSLSEGLTVTCNAKELDDKEWVVEMVCRNNTLKRVVIPRGRITNKEAINYVDDDVAGFGVTVTGFPDASGNTHYEYIKAQAEG